MFLYQKTIDRSALRQGFQIPVEFHDLLKAMPGGMPRHGETRNIRLIVEGREYDAQLKNQDFDQTKYAGHADVIQIRYGENSPLARKLREIFHSTWEYVEMMKSAPANVNRKVTIRIPTERQEYLAVSASDIPDVFVADCVTKEIMDAVKPEAKKMDELNFETFTPKEDPNAAITTKAGIQKIRRLDRSIGDSLKRLYDYRCQMTGERTGEGYDALVVEAHHIIPFTESLNNDTSNIIILSPTYHRIIHKANPRWDDQTLSFIFPNGLRERVKLNRHLGTTSSSGNGL
jgi:hypothetical protein